MNCAVCDEPAEVVAYACYAHAPHAVHPLVARYPMPMMWACRAHLVGLMLDDMASPSSTGMWVVVPC